MASRTLFAAALLLLIVGAAGLVLPGLPGWPFVIAALPMFVLAVVWRRRWEQ